MRIPCTEPSSVILSKTKKFKKFKIQPNKPSKSSVDTFIAHLIRQ